MTREEAIADIRDNIKPVVGGKSLDMAIEALEQAPCTDAISREKALQIIRAWFDREATPSDLKNEIEQLPPVTPAEKVGRWKRISTDKYSEHAKYWYRCDRCGVDNLGNTNYCPNCGAKIREVTL